MEDSVGIFITILVALLLGWSFLHAFKSNDVQSKCLAKGYAEHKVDWKFNGYCVKRDYQGSMYAVPLDKA